ncbi:hypothetical protein COT30_04985 [Candidatus Micrarchaeota archaeon CG08_land_8_20_14_0_20_49_17]|nr:MAG: hypothetical protein AUJ13_02580 [Candidatus Micrarchaeota archaeon CG1_02_49_24]PIU09315.1 MAG: hypothetical protein COT30_04985 [Candidatus Micrarchaeota archaeon CG08_land_8_20_14_0_20_49_17]HII53789.1 hypothetical protein [Candidatus Micrarchaeota archaeon]
MDVAFPPDTFFIMAMASILSLGLVTVFYFVAHILNLPKLKLQAKGEYSQVFASILLIVFATYLLGVFTNMSSPIMQSMLEQTYGASKSLEFSNPNYDPNLPASGDPAFTIKISELGNDQRTSTPGNFSIRYMENLANCLISYYTKVYVLNSIVEPVEKLSMEIGGHEPMMMWAYTPLVGILHIAAGYITHALVFVYVQMRALAFFNNVSLTFLLPLGLVLRSFALTRGAGAFLMALAISGYFLYPMTYVMMFPILGNSAFNCYHHGIGTGGEGTIDLPYTINSYLEADCGADLSSTMSSYYFVQQNDSGIRAFIKGLTDVLLPMITRVFILPAVPLVVLFTFMRALTSLFGADIAEIGRGLVKLI